MAIDDEKTMELLRKYITCHENKEECSNKCPLNKEVDWMPELTFHGSVGQLIIRIAPCMAISELMEATKVVIDSG